MSKYSLSVIIPHFNVPELLDRLIMSVPARDDVQIIVVDDNSTKKRDELNAVIEKYRERKLEFYCNETDKNSAGTCRNIGLDHAEGKWVIFADSDDYFVDGWFETVAGYFDSDYEIVYFRPTSIVSETGKTGNRHKEYANMVDAYIANPCHENEIQLRYKFPVPWSKLYSKAFIDRFAIRFEAVRYSNDERFALECGQNLTKFTCSDKTVYCVTLNAGSLTTTPSKENFDTRQRVYIRKYAFLYNNLSSEDIHILKLDFMPLFTVYNTVASGYGLKLALEYHKMLRELGVPLINRKYINPFRLIGRSFKSVVRRITGKI